MTGPVEEAGKVAGGIVDALKAQPAVLALSLAVLGLIGFLYYALAGAADYRDKMLHQQADFAKHVTDLLSRCVVPRSQTYITEPLKPLGEVEEPRKEP